LKKLDIVVASVHSGFKSTKEAMTRRIIKAIENPLVDILGHPTGRKINERPAYGLDFPKIFRAAKENNVCLEVNSQPSRLDLNDVNIRSAVDSNVKLVINTDSHSVDQMRFIELGVAQARRGWAEKKDILNTLSLKELPKYFKKIRI
jgi:DNA polymerase (family 10)